MRTPIIIHIAHLYVNSGTDSNISVMEQFHNIFNMKAEIRIKMSLNIKYRIVNDHLLSFIEFQKN